MTGVASSGPSIGSPVAELIKGVNFENFVLTARTGTPTSNASANDSLTRYDIGTLQCIAEQSHSATSGTWSVSSLSDMEIALA